jgi:hypothetical protein
MESGLKRKSILERIYFIVAIIVGFLTIINFVFDNSRSNETKSSLAILQKTVEVLESSINETNNLNSNLNVIINYFIHFVDSINKIDNQDISIPNSVKKEIKEANDLSKKINEQNKFTLIGRIINEKGKGIEGLSVCLKNMNESHCLKTDDHGYFQKTITHDTSLNVDFDTNIRDEQNTNLLLKNLEFNHNQTTTQKIKK